MILCVCGRAGVLMIIRNLILVLSVVTDKIGKGEPCIPNGTCLRCVSGWYVLWLVCVCVCGMCFGLGACVFPQACVRVNSLSHVCV